MSEKHGKSKPSRTSPSKFTLRTAGRKHAGLAISVAYVIAAVVVGLKFHVMGDGQSEADFLGAYVTQARSFLGGAVAIDPYRGPLYPMVLGVFYLLTRAFGAGLFETGIVLSAVSAGVLLFVTFQLLRELFSWQTALVVVGLLVTNPVFVRYSYTTGNDMFFAAMAMLTVYLFLRPRELRWGWVIGIGVLTALTYLTRYNGIAILAAAVVGVGLVNIWRLPWRTRVIAGLAFVAVFLVVITPWGLYCKQREGRFFYNKNYENIAYGFYLEEGYADRFMKEHEGQFESFVDVIAYDPGTFVRTIPIRTYGHVTDTMGRVLKWPLGLAAILGVIFLFIRRPDRRQLAYYLFGVAFAAVLILVFFAERFVLFLMPMLLVLGVEALRQLVAYVKPQKRSGLAFVITAVTLIGYSAIASAAYNKAWLKGGSIGFRQLGEWFVKTIPPGDRGTVVAARKPHFGYFAGLETIPIPFADSHEELIRYLHERGADYLFFSVVATQMREELAYLARVRDPKQAPPGLTLLAATSVGALYRVEK
jgi:hypothetical protein